MEAVAMSVIATLVAVQVAMLGLVLTRERLLQRRLRATVIATLKSGIAFRGVLFEVDKRSFVLRNTEALGRGDGTHVPVDGEVVLARSDVEFLQRP